jgi:hypothetical protein
LGSPFRTSNLNGITESDIYISGGTDGSSQLTLNFADGSFGVGDSFAFGIDVDLFDNINGFGATPDELGNAIVNFTFSDGYTVTSGFDRFIASSLFPSFDLPQGDGIMQGLQPNDFLCDSRCLDPIADPVAVPEPSALLSLVFGSIAFLGISRRKVL